LAQASHAARWTSSSAFATRKVISVEVLAAEFMDIEVIDRSDTLVKMDCNSKA
jgi:hypothetical protein